MNVLHQVNSLNIGGVETFVYRLAKHSNERVAIYSHEDGPVRKWLEQINIPVYIQYVPRAGVVLLTIEEVIEKENIDVLVMHTGSFYPDYALGLRKTFPKLKIVSCMHTICPGEPWVDRVIAISKAVFDAQVDKGITRLVYPGIERDHTFVIGEVTRLAPYKHLTDFITIANELAKDGIDFKFKIVGGEAADAKGYMSNIKEAVRLRGLTDKFEFTGYQDRIDWDEFDAFLHLVGGREAYPVTLLEALEHNLPTITADGLGTKEIQRTYEDLILVTSPSEAAAVLKVLANRRPKSMKTVANEMTAIYNEVLAE